MISSYLRSMFKGNYDDFTLDIRPSVGHLPLKLLVRPSKIANFYGFEIGLFHLCVLNFLCALYFKTKAFISLELSFSIIVLFASSVSLFFTLGIFCECHARFYFQRRLGFYLTQVYAPSILIVMLSWISFWLDPQSVPARTSLGILTILSLTNLALAGRSSAKVSYHCITHCGAPFVAQFNYISHCILQNIVGLIIRWCPNSMGILAKYPLGSWHGWVRERVRKYHSYSVHCKTDNNSTRRSIVPDIQ